MKNLLIFISILFLWGTLCTADTITLKWNANTEPDLAGYKLYYKTGTTGGAPYDGTGIVLNGNSAASPVDIGNVTQVTLDVPAGQQYIFALTAYDNETPPLESDYSNEVTYDATGSTSPPPDPEMFVVSFLSGGNGTISGTTEQTITSGGSSTSVTAVPNDGYKFTDWTGSDFTTTATNPLIVTNVTTAMTITANFESADATPPLSPIISSVDVSESNITLVWGAVPDNDIDHYKVYYGTNSRDYNLPIPVGNTTTYMLSSLNGGILYYFAVSAVDTSGNESGVSAEKTAIIPLADTTPPALAILSPATTGVYTTTIGTVVLSGTASDNVGIESITWKNSTQNTNGIALGTTNWNTGNIPLVEGNNSINVSASDAAGNISSVTIAVTYIPPDTTPPAVTILSPATTGVYATSVGVVALSGTASDNVGIESITWKNSTQNTNGIAIGTTNWNTGNIPLVEGNNTINVSASDAAGNISSVTIAVTYTPPDTTPPALAILSPATTGVYATSVGVVALSGTASDNVGIKSITWKNSTQNTSGIALGTTSWNTGNIPLVEGNNTINVSASDAAGNISSVTIAVTYTPPDTMPPQIAILSPTTGSEYTSQTRTVTLTGTATDNVGIVQVSWKNTAGGEGIASGTTNWTISDLSLSAGLNQISVTAEDGAGNKNAQTLSVIYEVQSDPTVVKDTGGTNDGDALDVCNNDINAYEATNFIASASYSMSKAELKLRKRGFPTMNLTCVIFTDNSGKPGSIIGRSNPISADTVFKDAKGTWTLFTFGNSVYIETGRTYWIGIYGPGGDKKNYLEWRYQSGASGNYSIRNSSNGTTWETREGSAQHSFQTY